ncbi:MAG: CatB-related O-acetyltransferase [Clostridia bacterium]|nr:CatB-related O-acetyltransferase [Clostridia bacterium]
MELSYVLGKLLQFVQIPQIHNSKIDKTSKVRFKSLVVESNIGKHSYISENSTVLYCDIGSFCSVASGCVIGGASHPIDWVSTSPVFEGCSSVLKKKFAEIPYDPYKKTEIGNDVWIGNNSLIKAGVKIADGAVIGMGSVVTHDVGPYEVWAGNPARLIKKRFDDETIGELLQVQWWNLPEDDLKKYGDLINEPKKFLEAISK